MSSLKQSMVWFKIKQPKQIKEKVAKYLKPISHKKKGKRGFFNIPSLFIGLLFLVFAVILLTVFTPIMKEVFGMNKGSSYNNCYGYVDSVTPSESYNASLPTSPIACPVFNFIWPMVIIAVIFIAVVAIINGAFSAPQGVGV